MDLFGRKVYSSSTLPVRVANYTALLAKYDHSNYGKCIGFINEILEEKRQQFKSLVSEGQMIVRTALQASLDSADTVARSTATAVIMQHALWFNPSAFPWEIQNTVKDLTLDGEKLFAAKTNEVMHTMKDSQGTLQSLGIHTPATRRRQYRYQPYQRNRYPTCAQKHQRPYEQQHQQQ